MSGIHIPQEDISDLPQNPSLLNPTPVAEGKVTCKEFGKEAETGVGSRITFRVVLPSACQAFRAPEVPGVTCWNARFWRTVGSG